MFKKRFVGDMCTPYRKKITSNQDHVGRVQRFSYDRGGGGWRGLRMSMEFETVAIATPCFLAKGCSYIWGSLPSLLFYPSRLTRREIYTRLRASLMTVIYKVPGREPLLQLAIDLQLGYTIIFNREERPQVSQRKYFLLLRSVAAQKRRTPLFEKHFEGKRERERRRDIS